MCVRISSILQIELTLPTHITAHTLLLLSFFVRVTTTTMYNIPSVSHVDMMRFVQPAAIDGDSRSVSERVKSQEVGQTVTVQQTNYAAQWVDMTRQSETHRLKFQQCTYITACFPKDYSGENKRPVAGGDISATGLVNRI